jgi:hypothetical protein
VGETDGADRLLAQAVEVATQRQDWPLAGALATHALTVVRDGRLDDHASSPLV